MNLFSPKTTPYILGGMALSLTIAYSLKSGDLNFSQQRTETIRQTEKTAGFDRQEAINRAKRCVVLMTETPITDSGTAYFSSLRNGKIVIHKNRPMPDGTTLCDTFGNTAIVQWDANGTPTTTEIRQMPEEEMKKILSKRGALPKKANKKIEFK
jgi:hypothetical protein